MALKLKSFERTMKGGEKPYEGFRNNDTPMISLPASSKTSEFCVCFSIPWAGGMLKTHRNVGVLADNLSVYCLIMAIFCPVF